MQTECEQSEWHGNGVYILLNVWFSNQEKCQFGLHNANVLPVCKLFFVGSSWTECYHDSEQSSTCNCYTPYVWALVIILYSVLAGKKNPHTQASIWHKNMLSELTIDWICKTFGEKRSFTACITEVCDLGKHRQTKNLKRNACPSHSSEQELFLVVFKTKCLSKCCFESS